MARAGKRRSDIVSGRRLGLDLRNMKRRWLLLTPFSLAVAQAARAVPARLGAIAITHPWAPPSVTEAAALFVRMRNDGSRADRLIAGTTPIADTVIFRAEDGSPLEYFDLLPGRPVDLRPGRRYIALRDLKTPLALDDTFPITLRFAEAGSITVTAIVEAGLDDDDDDS